MLNLSVLTPDPPLPPTLPPGVEPEPFEMGDHLVEASGKLRLLDSMLEFLHKGVSYCRLLH